MRFLAVLFIFVSLSTSAQLLNPTSGLTVEIPKILTQEEIKEFKYEAVDPEFWKKVTHLLDDKKYEKLVDFAAGAWREAKDSSDELEEAKLATAIGLSRLKISYGASVLLSELAKFRNNTKIGEAALYELNLLAQSELMDEDSIGSDLLVSNEFGPYHPDVESFIGYHAGLYNLEHGFKDWAQKEFVRVRVGTYWDYKLRYLKALGEIAREHIEPALQMFEGLRADEKAPQVLRTRSQWQVARLRFEQGDFKSAYDLTHDLDLPIRDKARTYLERAWSKFYLKDYAKSLGLLAVASTPVYSISLLPERYILEMLIYRELCHYEDVATTADKFRYKFGNAIQIIRARGELQHVPEIVNIILMNDKLQESVNFLNQIREERRLLREFGWMSYGFYGRLLQLYQLKDSERQDTLERDLRLHRRKVADDILDAEEQISFLEYTAKLDELRIVRKGENRTYQSEKITYLTFDKLFWPVGSQHWRDELEDYTMLIRSRCGEGQLMSSPTSSDKEFEEFK